MILKLTRRITIHIAIWAITVLALLFTSPAQADPVSTTPYQSFAGNINFQMTGASLRTQPNTINSCSVVSESTTTQARLTGLPAGATIIKAYLYWAGSGSSADIDSVVQFENQTITIGDPGLADSRLFTERFVYNGNDYDFFSGFADITDLNLINGNGVYDFSGLGVVTGGNYCSVSTVLGGWSLIVIYEQASEPLRVINLYHGFQYFQHSQIALTPSNFQVPTNGCNTPGDCKWGVLTWEGDPNLPDAGNPTPEVLSVNGTSITTGANPSGNQFNSTIDLLGIRPTPPGTAIHGVDIDVYPLPSSLSGATSATTRYSSGQDLVLLSAEIFSVRNTEVADLSISKSHTSNFNVGQVGTYNIGVTNNGPSNATGTVTVTDTLPTGLTYASGSDANWTCNAAGQVVTCTATSVDLAMGNSLPNLSLTVNVDATAASTVTNTASVLGDRFDNIMGNNTTTDVTNVINTNPSSGTKQLYFYMGNAPLPDRNTLQRTLVSLNTRSDIGAGGAVNFLLTPAPQVPLILENTPINVDLWLRRINPNNSGTRTVTVTLDDNGGPIGLIGTATITLSGSGMQWINFTFNPIPPTPITLLPGSTLRLNLTNASASGSIRARSFRSGQRSQIAFDTSTVINVDSVAAYTDVAYPGGVVQPNYAPNTPIRLRAVVSDPFGHDDITSAFITLNDPTGSPYPGVINQAMASIAVPPASPLSTRIFEYPWTIPAAGPNGIWTAIVTANEGNEGTVSDQGVGTFLVGMPNIAVTKTVTTISNPVEGTVDAHAIPGAIMQYDIVVTNTGINPIDPGSLIITDPLPENLRLVLNSAIEPVAFIDGNLYGQSTSGLSFDPADVGNNTGPFDDVAVSNWSGSGTRTYLPRSSISVDTEDVDNLTPKINFIRINPKGTFAGSTGGPDPSFTLRFRLKLE